MLSVVLRPLRLPPVCDRVKESILQQPQCPVVGIAEAPTGLDDLVEHGLESRSPGDGAKDGADRALLLAQILHRTSELRLLGVYSSHPRSLVLAADPAQTASPRSEPLAPTLSG